MDFLPFKQVDVFTRKPFLGNPVAVVFEAAKLSDTEMQRIAAWTNLSETTFVLPPSRPDADYRLRIFTPKQELPFAVHPTIGSAHAVLESGIAHPRSGRLKQECRVGKIDLEVEESRLGAMIFLKTPTAKISPMNQGQTNRLIESLGLAADLTRPPLRIDVGATWLIADLGDHTSVANLTTHLDEIRVLSAEMEAAGITVFGRVRDETGTLHVRSFAPILGVPEDPVCGSGNAAAAAYLSYTGVVRESGCDYLARQGMALGRAGEVSVRIRDSEISIGGFAVTCIDSRLRIS